MDVEILNGFPKYKLVLSPGGCAQYSFPVDSNQKYMFVQRARSNGEVYNPYCEGKVHVQAVTTTQSSSTSFTCFEDPTDCAAHACLGHLEAILDPSKAKGQQQVTLDVCNDAASARDAVLWEINFSASNDSNKLEAIFEESARERFQNLQNVPDYNTHITAVRNVNVKKQTE